MTRNSFIALVASLVLVSEAGCGRSDLATVQIGDLCFPTDDCTFSSTCDKVNILGQLWVDLTATSFLEYPIQIDNQRVNNADTESGRVNTNDAVIDSFKMTYQVSGSTIPGAVSPQTRLVQAAGSTVVGVVLIPPGSTASTALAALPAGTVVMVKLKAHGVYKDGTEFETGEHPIPVTMENGAFGGYSCTDTTKTVKSICPNNSGQSVNVVCG